MRLSSKGQYFLKRKSLVFHEITHSLAYFHCKPLRYRVGGHSETVSGASPSGFLYFFIPTLKVGAAGAVLGLSLDVATVCSGPCSQGSRLGSSQQGAPFLFRNRWLSISEEAPFLSSFPAAAAPSAWLSKLPNFSSDERLQREIALWGVGMSVELRRVFSIFHCFLVPQCQCQPQCQAQKVDISMCQFIKTIS